MVHVTSLTPGSANPRSRGDQHGAVAWLHRAGDVAGVAALALEQLPTASGAAADPGWGGVR
jgi:nuclear pore complex protein Nup85